MEVCTRLAFHLYGPVKWNLWIQCRINQENHDLFILGSCWLQHVDTLCLFFFSFFFYLIYLVYFLATHLKCEAFLEDPSECMIKGVNFFLSEPFITHKWGAQLVFGLAGKGGGRKMIDGNSFLHLCTWSCLFHCSFSLNYHQPQHVDVILYIVSSSIHVSL